VVQIGVQCAFFDDSRANKNVSTIWAEALKQAIANLFLALTERDKTDKGRRFIERVRERLGRQADESFESLRKSYANLCSEDKRSLERFKHVDISDFGELEYDVRNFGNHLDAVPIVDPRERNRAQADFIPPPRNCVMLNVVGARYFKRFELGRTGNAPVFLNIVADRPELLEAKPEHIEAHRSLVDQAHKLFGSYHYGRYDFLLALTDRMGGIGLEHHQSSENGTIPAFFTEWDKSADTRGLLPHEMAHSWNGKFRRPADMVVSDSQLPPKTRLLWVYEGLTNYYGEVLAARCGLWTEQEARDALAVTADEMSNSRGRAWRPLDDTAAANFVLLPAAKGWTSYRRSLDYYPEGSLIWLEADVIIRTKTKGQKSLDDFCRLFHGGEGGKPRVRGFTFDELAATLNEVVKHDWKAHLTRRVSIPNETPPLDGITDAGWKLTYSDKPTAASEAVESFAKALNLAPSVGLVLAGGKVLDVIPDSPATKAGLAPGVVIVAVNGRDYTDAGMKAAVAATKTGGKLELLTKTGDFYKTFTVLYKGGLRYPRLERGAGPDILADILKPLAPPVKK
jgi:predicted metalloprotease with PDZ domain